MTIRHNNQIAFHQKKHEAQMKTLIQGCAITHILIGGDARKIRFWHKNATPRWLLQPLGGPRTKNRSSLSYISSEITVVANKIMVLLFQKTLRFLFHY